MHCKTKPAFTLQVVKGRSSDYGYWGEVDSLN